MLFPSQDHSKTISSFTYQKWRNYSSKGKEKNLKVTLPKYLLTVPFLEVTYRNIIWELKLYTIHKKITNNPNKAPKWLTCIKLKSRLVLFLVEIFCIEGDEDWQWKHKVYKPHSWHHGPVKKWCSVVIALSKRCWTAKLQLILQTRGKQMDIISTRI